MEIGEWTTFVAGIRYMPACVELLNQREALKAELQDLAFGPDAGFRIINNDIERDMRKRLVAINQQIQDFVNANTPPRPQC